MTDPYRTPDPPPVAKPSLIARIRKARAANPLVGVVALAAVLSAIVVVAVTPGLLVLYVFKMYRPEVKPDPVLAPILTIIMAGAGTLAYKFLKGLAELTTELGEVVLKWIDERWG